jgi:hypothetical protein
MKQILFFSILVVFFLLSCCTRQKSSDDVFKDVPIVIDIDSVKRKEHLKLEHLRYLPLETSDECLFGYAEKVLMRDDKIYVADFSQAMALFVFDREGKFLFKIAQMGQGPGEYVSFHDFDIHRNGDIYMFDQHQRKFLVYSATGEYRHEIRSDYYFSNFGLVGNRMYWSGIYEPKIMLVNLAAYDMANKKTEFILKDKQFLYKTNVYASTYAFYYSSDDITYYSPQFSSIIYALDENGIRPAIGIKNLNIPSEDVINSWLSEKDLSKQINMIENSNYFRENTYIYETDKYIIFRCIRGPERDPLIYDKRTGKTCSFWYFFADIGASEAKGSTGQEFFGVVNFDSEHEDHKIILESREDLKNWKEGDNPVIVFFNPDM